MRTNSLLFAKQQYSFSLSWKLFNWSVPLLFLFQCSSVHYCAANGGLYCCSFAKLQSCCSHCVAPLQFFSYSCIIMFFNKPFLWLYLRTHSAGKKTKLLSMMEGAMRSQDEAVEYSCACKHTDWRHTIEKEHWWFIKRRTMDVNLVIFLCLNNKGIGKIFCIQCRNLTLWTWGG